MHEEQRRQKEIDELARIEEGIKNDTIGSNPMFEQIEQCEYLLKFCKRQVQNKTGTEETIEASSG